MKSLKNWGIPLNKQPLIITGRIKQPIKISAICEQNRRVYVIKCDSLLSLTKNKIKNLNDANVKVY